MSVFDLREKSGWFELDDGGRVQLKSLSAEDWKNIKKQTVVRKVDYKKVEGTPARLEYEKADEDLQNELFWDAVILNWEKFFDVNGKEIPCTKENKILLVSRSARFVKFVNDCLQTLDEDEAVRAEKAEKN